MKGPAATALGKCLSDERREETAGAGWASQGLRLKTGKSGCPPPPRPTVSTRRLERTSTHSLPGAHCVIVAALGIHSNTNQDFICLWAHFFFLAIFFTLHNLRHLLKQVTGSAFKKKKKKRKQLRETSSCCISCNFRWCFHLIIIIIIILWNTLSFILLPFSILPPWLPWALRANK